MTSPSDKAEPLRHRRWTLAILLPLLVVSGCAPRLQAPSINPGRHLLEQQFQQVHAIDTRLDALQRLSTLAWPLQEAAVELCPKPPQAALGLILANQHFFNPELRNSAIRHLGMGEVLQVTRVIDGSPAATAGVQTGDHLTRLQQPLPTGESVVRQLPGLLERLPTDQPVELELVRGQQPLTLTLKPAAHCRYPLALLASDQVNAFATGDAIQVTEGMVRFAEHDWDLAFILAHELAHNLLQHPRAKTTSGSLGGLIDLWLIANGVPSPGLVALGGTRLHSQAFEAEADYLALYLMARAGYPLDQDSNYWRRVAAWRPGGITPKADSTHPDTSRRYLAMQRTLAEIQEKQRLGQPLMPTLRGND